MSDRLIQDFGLNLQNNDIIPSKLSLMPIYISSESSFPKKYYSIKRKNFNKKNKSYKKKSKK